MDEKIKSLTDDLKELRLKYFGSSLLPPHPQSIDPSSGKDGSGSSNASDA
jgi:hypothetical protein